MPAMSRFSAIIPVLAAVIGLSVPLGSPGTVAFAQAADGYQVGDQIEAWHNGNGQFKWMKSTILEMKDGRYKIHYGGSQYNTTWITADKIKGSQAEAAKQSQAALSPTAEYAKREIETQIASAEQGMTTKTGLDRAGFMQGMMQINAQTWAQAATHPQFAELQSRYWQTAIKCFDAYLGLMQEMIGGKTIANNNWVKGHGAGGTMIKQATSIADLYRAYASHDAATLARMDGALAKANGFRAGAETRVEEEKMAKRQMPQDTYHGGDAAAIKAKITASWRATYPNLPITAVRLDGNWTRDAGWQRTTTNAYWTDRYVMYASVICKTDARVATIYPVLVARDNVQRGLMEVKVTDHGINSYVPSKMLLQNVR
jgi:hypothetical protein